MPDTFVILDDGETLITGTWEPTPKDTSARLLALANYYEDMMPALIASRQAAIDSTELHFEYQTDPSGAAWAALDEDYKLAKIKGGFPEDEILVRTGAGKAAATGPAWVIWEDTLWFDETKLPDYMWLHQIGTEGLGAAQGTALDKIAQGQRLTSDETALINKGGGGKNLPKREFIGFTEDDTAVFADIWNKWFEAGIVEEFPE